MDSSEKAELSKAIVGAFHEDGSALVFGSDLRIGSGGVFAAVIVAADVGFRPT